MKYDVVDSYEKLIKLVASLGRRQGGRQRGRTAVWSPSI